MIYTVILLAVAFGIGFIIGNQSLQKDRVTNTTRIEEENVFLRDQIEKLKETINYWSSQATTTHEVQNKIFQNYNTNAATTISSIIGMLQALQHSPQSNISRDDRLRIERMIEQAKGIG